MAATCYIDALATNTRAGAPAPQNRARNLEDL